MVCVTALHVQTLEGSVLRTMLSFLAPLGLSCPVCMWTKMCDCKMARGKKKKNVDQLSQTRSLLSSLLSSLL